MSLSSPPLILASTSPIRRQLLEQSGLSFRCIRPDFTEEMPEDDYPDFLALRLAEGKAESVAMDHPDAVVIGADQVGECEGRLLGKAASPEEALEVLSWLAGKTHRLCTGVVVIGPTPDDGGARPTIRFVEETRLTFRPLEPEELKSYVATGEWEGCAGCYRLEGRGIHLVEKLEGDYFNILGLPLVPLMPILRHLGIRVL